MLRDGRGWLQATVRSLSLSQDGVITLRTDRSTPQPSACTTPSSEDQASPVEVSSFISDPHNPLMTALMPHPGPSTPGVQLMPPGVCVFFSQISPTRSIILL